MPIAKAFQSLPDKGKEELIADVAHVLSGYVVDGQIVYPDAVHVVTGVK